MPKGNVDVLSESEGEGCDLIPEPPPIARPKRKRSLKSDGEAIDSETTLRKILSGRCLCKKQDCFRAFAPNDDFQNLLRYRDQYVNMHKLDQDHFVPKSLFGF